MQPQWGNGAMALPRTRRQSESHRGDRDDRPPWPVFGPRSSKVGMKIAFTAIGDHRRLQQAPTAQGSDLTEVRLAVDTSFLDSKSLKCFKISICATLPK